MDFFKKIFEKVGGGAGAEGGTDSQVEGGMDQSQSMGGSKVEGEGMRKDHDGGHPNGGGGKNVCQFC